MNKKSCYGQKICRHVFIQEKWEYLPLWPAQCFVLNSPWDVCSAGKMPGILSNSIFLCLLFDRGFLCFFFLPPVVVLQSIHRCSFDVCTCFCCSLAFEMNFCTFDGSRFSYYSTPSGVGTFMFNTTYNDMTPKNDFFGGSARAMGAWFWNYSAH